MKTIHQLIGGLILTSCLAAVAQTTTTPAPADIPDKPLEVQLKVQPDVTPIPAAEPVPVQTEQATIATEPVKDAVEQVVAQQERANKNEGLVQFEGRWVKPAEAARLEEVRYRKQRIDAPIEVVIDATAEQLRVLSSRRDLSDALMAFLRVGDRLIIQHNVQQWPFWKRHSKPTDNFRQAIAALRKTKPVAENWTPDPVTSIKAGAIGADLLTDAMLAMHASRNTHSHADMVVEQLPAKGTTVKRTLADGSLTVLAVGGEQVQTKTGKPARFGTLSLLHVAPGAEALALEWTTPPQRLLVVGDTVITLLPPPKDVSLRKHEKKVIRLIADSKGVTAIRRFSQGPDYKGWQQQTIAASGPLGFQMDLGRDEIGPHEAAGDYRRVWILDIGDKDGATATQRQIGMSYRVKDDEKDALSREFLRR